MALGGKNQSNAQALSGDQDSGMVIEQQTSSSMPARITRQECQRRAQKCIDESTKAPHPVLQAHWLALAEQWVNAAERLFEIKRDPPS
jgi:hypothetical protein